MGTSGSQGPSVKGSVVRGWVDALERAGLTARVLARCSPAAKELLLRPPVATAWVPSLVLAELYDAVLELEGSARLRGVARDSTNSTSRLSMPLISGLMRLFGVVPSTLLQRMNQLTSAMAQGVQYEYKSLGPDSGEMLVQFEGMPEPSRGTILVMESSFETVIDLASHRGQVSVLAVEKGTQASKARFLLRWEKR